MKLGTLTAIVTIFGGLLAITAAPAAAAPFTCTGTSCTYTGAGGGTLADPTLLPALPGENSYVTIDGTTDTTSYYEFAWGGGTLKYGLDFSSTVEGRNLDVAIYSTEGVLLGTGVGFSDAALEIPTNGYNNLSTSIANPGDYIIEVSDDMLTFGDDTPVSQSLNFQRSVGGVQTATSVPEPLSLALIGSGLLGFGLLRRRHLRPFQGAHA